MPPRTPPCGADVIARPRMVTRVGSHRRAGGIPIAAGLVLLAACQSTMSIEEAKKVTATFEGQAFVPPPRTISDITAILDQEKRANPTVAAEAEAQADRKAPATTDP